MEKEQTYVVLLSVLVEELDEERAKTYVEEELNCRGLNYQIYDIKKFEE